MSSDDARGPTDSSASREVPEIVVEVEIADDRSRLDVFLAGRPEIGSRSRAKQLIEHGLVRVDGGRVKAGLSLQAGWVVAYRPDFGVEVTDDTPLPIPAVEVLYEDAHLVVIDKPPLISAHPRTQKQAVTEPTIASWMVARYGETGTEPLPSPPDANRPGIVHRLDRETSGVMVLARTQLAMDGLRAQFRARTVEKHYRALSYGEPRFDSDWIEKPLMPNPRQPDRMVVAREGGKDASTFYEVLERFEGFTWFGCRPRTGRTHQIRVHLASIGHSLVGDRAYRSRNNQTADLPEGAPEPGRHCLHAFRLHIDHPRTGERLVFEAPLPRDIGALLEWLRANRRKP